MVYINERFSYSNPVQLEIKSDDAVAVDGEASDEDDADEEDSDKDDANEEDANENDTDNEGSNAEDVNGDGAEGSLEAIHELPTFNPFSNVHPVWSPFWLKNSTTPLSFTSIHATGRSLSVPQASTFNVE
ncbi:hypothetical protein VN97_g1859 [Penicillium thymicola]|uniref:Uncharacterized protein n=1 Tax=Penicillium thymicola TaxID=293382 RepID=A0AAI9TQZ4_PENTH|nr:hypothetical protein VN97_g1859 [Penicillium thymicola]